jgi:hypothetical protein
VAIAGFELIHPFSRFQFEQVGAWGAKAATISGKGRARLFGVKRGKPRSSVEGGMFDLFTRLWCILIPSHLLRFVLALFSALMKADRDSVRALNIEGTL